MLKQFLHVEAQVELLRARGMVCGPDTARVLQREGYYAVINGYGKPFLDRRASAAANEDRYAPDTEFAHVYALYCFDRELRSLTFGALTRVEGMLRSVVAASFLETHLEPNAYLQEENYSTKHHYLLGADAYEHDLRHLISTLSRCAREHEHDERGRDDARLAHYRKHYDEVPLWVVFSDFSYGNLHHFVALMKRAEQTAACERLARVLAGNGEERRAGDRQQLVSDMAFQVEVRNLCAHGERLYDAVRYDRFTRMLNRYLPADDYARFHEMLARLVAAHTGMSPALDRALVAARMDVAATAL